MKLTTAQKIAREEATYQEIGELLGDVIPCYRPGQQGCRLDDAENEELCADGCHMLRVWRHGFSAARAALQEKQG